MFKTILFIAALFISASTFAQPSVGQAVPEVSLPDAKGNVQKLSSLKGKVVLIDFWASWCGPCRKANKEMLSLYSKYRDKGFEIYAISLDQDKGEWKSAIASDKMNWMHVIETGGKDDVSVKWKIEFLPTSFLLDKDGKLVAVDPSKSKIESYLKQNLSAKP
ncbi:MAG: TlpA disulfide reductase family protein [Chitinophagaceae bacterium]